MKHFLILFLCCLTFGLGCSGEDDEPSVCSQICEAQSEAEKAGNCEVVSLNDCKTLCGYVGSGPCSAELEDLHKCWLTGEFSCSEFGSAQSDATCETEEAATSECAAQNSCTGADENGFCPSVTCDCGGEPTSISAVSYTADGCVCADESTCTDYCP